MFPCALTSERCRANFRPQFLAFWSAESKSFPWPTCMIKDMETAARNKWSMMYVLYELKSELTFGSPLRSSPTTTPSLESRKSSASFTVSMATSGPCLRSTATRNLCKHTVGDYKSSRLSLRKSRIAKNYLTSMSTSSCLHCRMASSTVSMYLCLVRPFCDKNKRQQKAEMSF